MLVSLPEYFRGMERRPQGASAVGLSRQGWRSRLCMYDTARKCNTRRFNHVALASCWSIVLASVYCSFRLEVSLHTYLCTTLFSSVHAQTVHREVTLSRVLAAGGVKFGLPRSPIVPLVGQRPGVKTSSLQAASSPLRNGTNPGCVNAGAARSCPSTRKSPQNGYTSVCLRWHIS